VRQLRLDREEALRLLPAAGVLITWTVLMFDAGGFRPTTFLPAGLVILALLVLAALAQGRVLPEALPVRRALLVLAAFTGWCFVSVLWSDARGSTWEASNLLLIGLAGAWVMALTVTSARIAWALMLLFSVAAGVACFVALVTALGETDLTSRFEDFRFSPPLDYPNTTAAFAFMATIPALLLAVRPDASVPARGLGQGLATFLAGFALLPQSRGAILGSALTLVVLAILLPYRWRLLWHVGLLALTLVVLEGPAHDVYTAGAAEGHPSDALRDAAFALGGVSLLATFAGALLAALESRFSVRGEARETTRRIGLALTGLAVVGVLGVAAVRADAISDAVSDQWRSLKHPGVEFAGKQANSDAGRLNSIDPLERYDYWRVDIRSFLHAPVNGGGAGSFEHNYLLHRRYPKVSRYPHNLAVKVVGETGLVGLALIGAFVALVVAGLWRARELRIRERVLAAGALALLAYYVAHGMFDWLEAYPVLTGPALGFPFLALAAIHGESGAAPVTRRPWRGYVALAVSALAALSLLLPWLSLRYQDRATSEWRTNPGVAYRDLDRAAALNFLSPEPEELRGVIGLSGGDLVAAERGFRRALDREERWLPHFGLGAAAAALRDERRADAEFAEARRLNRADPVLPEVIKDAHRGGVVNPATLIRDVLVSPFFDTEQLD
jgi:O-antigen ligase